jgi:2-succinyl-6-hydroxy-2,4-cyclohexadiene-1-carboxylate synthase
VTKLFCIHGNFQTSKVWEPLARSFKAKNSDLEVISVSLKDHPQGGFEPWTQDFCNEVDTQAGRNKPYLLGYSLGGRLALHACIHRPDLWQGVVVVGADPGLGSSEEKKHQFTSDCNWADRLKKEPLEELVREWDEHPVFCGIENSAPRNLDELDTTQLSQQFEIFSKGLQQNLVPALSELKTPPILFLSGEKDQKYQGIGEKLSKSSSVVKAQVVPDSGHRVPWENPESFSQVLIDFANWLNSSSFCE